MTSQFLGADAAFPAGPWLLAHTLRCPVYFVAGVYTRPRHYALHFELLADEVVLDRRERSAALTRYSQAYASMLETYARSAPLELVQLLRLLERADMTDRWLCWAMTGSGPATSPGSRAVK